MTIQDLQSRYLPLELELMRRAAVEKATGLPTSSLYALILKGDFPKPIQLTVNRVAWRSDQVRAWIQAKIAAAEEPQRPRLRRRRPRIAAEGRR